MKSFFRNRKCYAGIGMAGGPLQVILFAYGIASLPLLAMLTAETFALTLVAAALTFATVFYVPAIFGLVQLGFIERNHGKEARQCVFYRYLMEENPLNPGFTLEEAIRDASTLGAPRDDSAVLQVR